MSDPTEPTAPIRLVSRHLGLEIDLEVRPGEIADAACLIHKGRYYVYQRITATAIEFGEVGPPVEVT